MSKTGEVQERTMQAVDYFLKTFKERVRKEVSPVLEKRTSAKAHEDERGKIRDLLVGNGDTAGYSVTHITFKHRGDVRGNHFHKETEQVDYLLKGSLKVKTSGMGEAVAKLLVTGDRMKLEPGVSHAYMALEDDTEMLSVCFGKRVGENYESDTFRLEEKDKLL